MLRLYNSFDVKGLIVTGVAWAVCSETVAQAEIETYFKFMHGHFPSIILLIILDLSNVHLVECLHCHRCQGESRSICLVATTSAGVLLVHCVRTESLTQPDFTHH